jgi:NAD-dependent DNA ligase
LASLARQISSSFIRGTSLPLKTFLDAQSSSGEQLGQFKTDAQMKKDIRELIKATNEQWIKLENVGDKAFLKLKRYFDSPFILSMIKEHLSEQP